MDINNEFIAFEKDLQFYAGKPVINREHVFLDSCGGPYSFDQALSFGFKVWEEREGGLQVINWTSPENLSANGNIIYLNAPAEDTDIEIGKYYYEMTYLIAGGYEILIAYGDARFI